jgi:hypothetical protein
MYALSSDLDNLATPFHDKDELDLPLSSYDDYSGQVLNHHRAPLRLGIDSEPGAVCRSHKKAIMFYSVNAPHPGLSMSKIGFNNCKLNP